MDLLRKAIIPRRTPSQNSLHWAHWSRVHRVRREWQKLATLYVGRPDDPATGKRTVRITRHSPRTLDTGNLVGGCKALVDSLVELRWIKDDSPEWADIKYGQEPVSKGNATIVEIFEGEL